jgi:hypothetical protein
MVRSPLHLLPPMSTPMSTRTLLLFSLLIACGCARAPEIQRSKSAKDAEYNCELMALASEWHCLPEQRIVPLSCSWGKKPRYGAVTLEGSTGCVTMTCEEVLSWAELDCTEHQEGEVILGNNATNECCTADDCGVEFGCY